MAINSADILRTRKKTQTKQDLEIKCEKSAVKNFKNEKATALKHLQTVQSIFMYVQSSVLSR